MKALKEWTSQTDPNIQERSILAFDLDDTLTSESELMPISLEALRMSRAAGLRNVLVTGRPASWADALLRLLPFDAAVAENGSVVFWKDSVREGNVSRLYWHQGQYRSEAPSSQVQEQLMNLRKEVQSKFPKFVCATDQAFRLYDVAFDFAESVRPALSLGEAEELAHFCESLGFSAKVSNIHVNVWKGNFTKIEGLRCLVDTVWGLNMARHVIYTGDSPNDGPLFGAVEISVGVANVRDFIEAGVSFSHPAYVTTATFGDGAAELVAHRLKEGGRVR